MDLFPDSAKARFSAPWIEHLNKWLGVVGVNWANMEEHPVKEFGIFIYLPHYLNQNWEGVEGGGEGGIKIIYIELDMF